MYYFAVFATAVLSGLYLSIVPKKGDYPLKGYARSFLTAVLLIATAVGVIKVAESSITTAYALSVEFFAVVLVTMLFVNRRSKKHHKKH